jgi:hypothetical protein
MSNSVYLWQYLLQIYHLTKGPINVRNPNRRPPYLAN